MRDLSLSNFSIREVYIYLIFSWSSRPQLDHSERETVRNEVVKNTGSKDEGNGSRGDEECVSSNKKVEFINPGSWSTLDLISDVFPCICVFSRIGTVRVIILHELTHLPSSFKWSYRTRKKEATSERRRRNEQTPLHQTVAAAALSPSPCKPRSSFLKCHTSPCNSMVVIAPGPSDLAHGSSDLWTFV